MGMKRGKRYRDVRRRNFGFGRKLRYACHKAVDWFYGNDKHLSTRYTHKRRVLVFTDFCYRCSVTDARDIDLDLMEQFGDYVRARLEGGYEWPDGSIDSEIRVSYAQNLISTVNTVMRILRGDYVLRISPSGSVCRQRSFTRSRPVDFVPSDVLAAVDELNSSGLNKSAALTLMAYAWGTRVREALLQDLKRMFREIALTGSAAILEGCKGGRSSAERTVFAGPLQIYALEVAMNARPTESRNLLSEDDTVRSVVDGELRRGRSIIKKHSIISYRELRSAFAVGMYETLTGGCNPLHGRLPERDLDRAARAEISRMLGHKRIRISNSYIGGY